MKAYKVIVADDDQVEVGKVYPKKENSSAVLKFHTGKNWMMFYNNFYDETMAMDFPNEHYRSPSAVPLYNIHDPKESRQIAYGFSRENLHGGKYLFILKVSKGQRRKPKYPARFYVFSGMDDDGVITEMASVVRLFNKKNDELDLYRYMR